MKGNCAICDAEIEVEMCCSGYMCGCMGMPIEPPVCSSKNECYDKYMQKIKKRNDNHEEDVDFEIKI
jgi:hypothetical protein